MSIDNLQADEAVLSPPAPGMATSVETPSRPNGKPATTASNGTQKGRQKAKPKKRSPLVRELLLLTRRSHLYAGLFLLPWVFLYGVTGILFNHPDWFPDRVRLSFGESVIEGTPLASMQTPDEMAAAVVAMLNNGEKRYQLIDDKKPSLGRGGLSATLSDVEAKSYSLSIASHGNEGSIQEARRRGGGGGGGGNGGGGGHSGAGQGGGERGSRPEGAARGESAEAHNSEERESEVTGQADHAEQINDSDSGVRSQRSNRDRSARGQRGPAESEENRNTEVASAGESGRNRESAKGQASSREEMGESRERGEGRSSSRKPSAPFAVTAGLMLPESPVEQLRESIPALLEKSGFGTAEVESVQMAPLEFQMRDDKSVVWNVTYDAQKGAVSGITEKEAAEQLAERQAGFDLSFRRYLLNLHKARGYPDEEVNVRSFWALAVDAMSFTMCFWGISGVVMWWQIKRTRPLGTACLIASLFLAVWVGIEMYGSMRPG